MEGHKDILKIKSFVPGFNAGIRFDTCVGESVANFLATSELQQEDVEFDKFTDLMIQKYSF